MEQKQRSMHRKWEHLMGTSSVEKAGEDSPDAIVKGASGGVSTVRDYVYDVKKAALNFAVLVEQLVSMLAR